MKKLLLFFVSVSLTVTAYSQGFQTVGAELHDANGNNFIMKGLNVPLAWYVTNTLNSIDDIRASTGANTLRIVVETTTSDADWQTAVQYCIDNNMIPMVELHSVTGSNSPTDLQNMADWWAARAAFLTRSDIEPYILINIANEWGDWYMASPNNTPDQTVWRDAYIAAVQTLRDAGITTTIVVDAPGYGQDHQASTLLNYADDVIAADPESNVLFSVHMYCEWRIGGGSSVSTHLPAIKNAGIPIIVGEFGFQHATDGSCDIDEEQIMSTSESNGIGWLAWSWIGNSGGVEYLDMSNDWAGTNLTDWGNTVVNGTYGTKTAVDATVFSSSNNKPQVDITSPSNNAEFSEGDNITITANASDTDGSVSGVAFYNGAVLLGSDNTAPYSFTWNNVQAGTYTITARATDDLGGVTTSDPVTLTVISPCETPDLGPDRIICPGSVITLNSGVSSTNSPIFEWRKDGELISNASSGTLEVSEAGTYEVTVQIAGCNPVSDATVITAEGMVVSGDTICEAGEITLSVGEGTGPYEWYSAADGGSPLATGASFLTTISQSATFYVEDAGATSSTKGSLGKKAQDAGVEQWNLTSDNFGENDKNVAVTVSEELTIDAVHVYSNTSNNNVTIRVLSGTTVVDQATATVGTGKQRIPVDFSLVPGDYTIDAVGTTGGLQYQSAGATFPYEIQNVISFTGTQSWVINDGRYGFFYDWEVTYGVQGSLCGRMPVEAVLDPEYSECTVTAIVNADKSTFQAAPNPFTGETEIRGKGAFTYSIFSTNGVLIEEGRREEKLILGQNLVSGIYFVKVESADGVQIVRINKR